MGVLKLSGSGKALLVVLDSGEVFVVPRSGVEGLLSGRNRFGALVLTKLPFGVSPGRFPKSPVYEPSSVEADRYGHLGDAMIPRERQKVDLVSDVDVKL